MAGSNLFKIYLYIITGVLTDSCHEILVLYRRRPGGDSLAGGERARRLRYGEMKEAVRGSWESMRFESCGERALIPARERFEGKRGTGQRHGEC